jgi:hypothetical protein
MANSFTSDNPVELIESLCRDYRRGIITSESAMAKIIAIASAELILSVEEQEKSIPVMNVW